MTEERICKTGSQPTLQYWEENADIRESILSGYYKLNAKKGRSKIWKIYDKIEDTKGVEIPRKVCCRKCFAVLSYDPRTTSNLLKHKCYIKFKDTNSTVDVSKTSPTQIKFKLNTNWRETRSSKVKDNIFRKKVVHHTKENGDIKNSVLSGSFKLNTKSSRSKIWNIFGTIEDNEGVELLKKVCCRKCFSVLNYDSRNTSNLVKHKCYVKAKEACSLEIITNTTPNPVKRTISTDLMQIECCDESEQVPSFKINVHNDLKVEAVKIFSQWCIENFRPFQLTEDTGIKRFAKFMISVGANYGTNIDIDNLLPDAVTISENIENLFDTQFEKVKNEIVADCKYGYGLTSEIWTDNYWQHSYISLTIHYIKNGQLNSKLLGLNLMDSEESSTNDMIGLKIQGILNDYNCTFEDSIIVTGGSCSMVNALSKFTHINCINHLLNNVIENAIKKVKKLGELYKLSLKVRKYFEESDINYNLSTIFKSFCRIKWNAVYYLLDTIEKNWLEIKNILKKNSQLKEIENMNINYINSVLNILQPFEHASKILEGEKYPTIHLVYAYINGLKDSCLPEHDDDDVIRQFKEILSDQLQTTVLSNLSITHKIALFLFPPANKLIQFNEEEKNLIKTEITSHLKPYVQNERQEIKKEPSNSSLSNTMISSYFKNFVTPSTNFNCYDKLSNEIRTYENLSIPFDDNFDILQWWNLRQSQFPLLYKLSCKILAAPASCASSERVFSIVRYLSENNTNILSNSKAFNQIIYLNFNGGKNIEIESCKSSQLYRGKSRTENDVIEII